MEQSSWVSYGAHTMHHPVLAYLTDSEEVKSEVCDCQKHLKLQLGHPVPTFAYPVGKLEHIGYEGLQSVRNSEYSWAVTTVNGVSTGQSDPFLLQRLLGDVSRNWLVMAAEVSGIWKMFSPLWKNSIFGSGKRQSMASDGLKTFFNEPTIVKKDQNTINSFQTKSYDALVFDASLRQSLVAVRSLGRQGLHVAALDTLKTAPTFSSRWCKRSFINPSYETTEEYLIYLEHLLDLTGAKVLISSSDSSIALLRQQRKRLESKVHIALAKEPALSMAINKELTLEIASRLGLSVPHSVPVRSLDEIKMALHEIGLPAVVKPTESWIWCEQSVGINTGKRIVSQLVTTHEEAQLAVEALTSAGGTTLFQQFLAGRREAMSFLYSNGEMYARFAQWAKRTEPPLGGTSVLRQSIAIPEDVGKQAERLIREIELEGYSEVEFRRDSKGVPYIMEINPRLSASVEIAVRSGVDFPYLLYQWANGEKIQRVLSYRTGGWMRHLKGDIMATIESIQQHGRPGVTPPEQTILSFLSSFFVPMGYDYLDWKDPKPAIIATRDFTSNWIGSAIRKRLAITRKMRGTERHA